GELRLDLVQFLLGQAVQFAGHGGHAVHGAGVFLAVLPQGLPQPLDFRPQPFPVVADSPADLLLQFLRFGQLLRLLLQLGRSLASLLGLPPQFLGSLAVSLLLGLFLSLLGLLLLASGLLAGFLGFFLGLGGLALGGHLAPLANALLDLPDPLQGV